MRRGSNDLIPYDVGPDRFPSGQPVRDLIPRREPAVSDDLAVWLRRCIEQRMYLATHAIELGNAAKWTELSSGVLMTCSPEAPGDQLDGLWPMGDSSLTRLMAANDPRDTIARCEAELAILNEHATKIRPAGWGVPGQVHYWCETCNVPGDFPGRNWCRTVLLLASGYRHAMGYRQEWKP